MITITKSMARDVSILSTLSIKCHEYPHSLDIFKILIDDDKTGIYIAKISGRAVGYVSILYEDTFVEIDRLGVVPDFRNLGISKKLFNTVKEQAEKLNKKYIYITVPCYKVDDMEDPWNIKGWLEKCGFEAIEVVEQAYRRYGRDYDGYVFRQEISQASNR
jgi:N-acetylglutamate synthase-like GNAT family acetyltransferase